jgi:hypothetical protein
MPCSLQPWEIEFEERRANKEKYGIDLADASLITRLLCEAVKLCPRSKMSNELRLWADAHAAQDKRKAVAKKAKPKRKRKRRHICNPFGQRSEDC